MATWVSAELCELKHSGKRLARYIALCCQTIRLIKNRHAEIIFFQNPSIVLSMLIVLLKKLGIVTAKIVGDFHNAGVYPKHGASLCRWIVRGSDLTIVSNENLARVVNGWGGRAIAIPDPLPVIDSSASSCKDANEKEFRFLFVCSWADDEPVVEVVRAAAALENDFPFFKIYITGRPKLEKCLNGISLPGSVALTGFLSEEDFDGLLYAADVVIDLTTRPDCMVCGAYEAIAAEKPAILSDNQPTRAYFDRGVEFTDNTATDIAARLISSYQNIEAMRLEIKLVKQDILLRETQSLDRLNNLLA
jgi:glycosyltransferase involved in cell wall biosynthesis